MSRAAIAVGFVLILTMSAGGALAAPPPPTPLANPDPTSQGAQDVQAYATSSLGAEEEILVSTVNTSFTTYNAPDWQLTDYSVQLNPWYDNEASFHLVRATTWVNLTHGCTGAQSCPGYYTCGGTFLSWTTVPQSYRIDGPCSNLWVNWTKTNNLPNYPTWSITRLITVVHTMTQTWTSQAREDYGYSNITAVSYEKYDVGFTTIYDPNYTAVLGVSLWVPYPAGNWYLPYTTFQSLDSGVIYPQADYVIGTAGILVQWGAGGFTFAEYGHTYHYLFTLTSLTSNTTSPTNTTTRTNESGSPPPSVQAPIGEIVLMLGNVSTSSAGRDTSYALWLNTYPYNFTGTVYAEAPWLGSASNITLYVNGVPLPRFDYSVDSAAIVIFSGILTVTSESEVSISATYTPVSLFTSFYQTLFYLDGYPVNVWGLLLLVGLGASFGIVWVEFDEPKGPARKSPTMVHRLLVAGLAILYGALIFAL